MRTALSEVHSKATAHSLLRGVWDLREDLREQFAPLGEDPDDFSASPGFAWWIYSHGLSEYPALRVARRAIREHFLWKPAQGCDALRVESLFGHSIQPYVPTLLGYGLWLSNSNLTESFPISAGATSGQGFVQWLALHGCDEFRLAGYPGMALIDPGLLARLRAVPEDNRIDLGCIDSAAGRLRSAHRLAFSDFDSDHCYLGLSIFGEALLAHLGWCPEVSCRQTYLHHALAELISGEGQRHVLTKHVLPESVFDYFCAYESKLRTRGLVPEWKGISPWARPLIPGVAYRCCPRLVNSLPRRLLRYRDTDLVEASAARSASGGLRSDGLNIVGYITGDLGIGEEARSLIAVCDAVGIPVSVIDLTDTTAASPSIGTYRDRIVESLGFDTTVVCLAAQEHQRVFLEARIDARVRGTCIVGYWPWELPRWPKQWSSVFEFTDQIWSFSRFTLQSFRSSAEERGTSVYLVPQAVIVPENSDDTAVLKRESTFKVGFIFDGLSYPKRKNPSAVVRAFLQAFPAAEVPDVALEIKTLRLSSEDLIWQGVPEELRGDRRVRIIADSLSRSALLALVDSWEVYVSLHRSEGFGRTIAEAILLGKQVIATGWSGNTDFALAENYRLVGCGRVDLAAGDYPGSEFGGQHWAEPDISEAADWLREFYFGDTSSHLGSATKESQ